LNGFHGIAGEQLACEERDEQFMAVVRVRLVVEAIPMQEYGLA
jgi:hypothetical protein